MKEKTRKLDDKLYYFNKQLRSLVEPVFENNLVVNNLKGGFLSFSFGKAYKTHASLLILCKSGSGQDAAILTRSLFELAVTVSYILNDVTDNRIERFMEFDWVIRQTMCGYLKSKPKLNEKLQREAEKRKVSIDKIIQKAEEVQKKHKYDKRKGWSDKSIKGMAEEVGLGDLYLTAYRLFSNLHHSAVSTINEYLNIDKDGAIEIDSGPSSKWVEQSLVGAFHFFGIIIEKWSEYFHLGLNDELKILTDKYVKEIGEVKEKT